MAEKIIYRKAGIDELEMYHSLRLDCLKRFPEHFGTVYFEEQKSSEFKFDRVLATVSGTDFLMGAFSGNKLIGICGFIQEKREKTRHIGEVSSMYVATEFSGRRVGARLLGFTLSTAFENVELEQIVLAVVDKNQIARNLYGRFGFVEYGRLGNYFKYNGKYETQIFMTLTRDKYRAMNC